MIRLKAFWPAEKSDWWFIYHCNLLRNIFNLLNFFMVCHCIIIGQSKPLTMECLCCITPNQIHQFVDTLSDTFWRLVTIIRFLSLFDFSRILVHIFSIPLTPTCSLFLLWYHSYIHVASNMYIPYQSVSSIFSITLLIRVRLSLQNFFGSRADFWKILNIHFILN